jgi:hypothetical protein
MAVSNRLAKLDGSLKESLFPFLQPLNAGSQEFSRSVQFS